MFGFLKKKLKDAVNVFSRKAELEEEPVSDEAAIKEALKEEATLHEEPAEEITFEDSPSAAERQAPEEPPAEEPQDVAEDSLQSSQEAEQQPAKPQEEAGESDTGESDTGESNTEASAVAEQPAAKTAKLPRSAPEERAPEPHQPTGNAPKFARPTTADAETRGFLGRLKNFTKKKLSPEQFDELFWDLELALLESNVAVEVIEKIKEDLKTELTSGKVSRLGLQDLIMLRLKQSIDEILSVPTYNLAHAIRDSTKRPYIIMFLGVNGGGKTTTLAKLANKLMNHDLSVVIAAADTFRAAAIDQLHEHAKKLGVKMISQGYNADPAAVAYDAIEHAKAKGIDVVLIDTAGRLHSNKNLMAELEKVARVAKPDLKLFVGESITGNDCVEQAKAFDEIVGIDAIILSKADIDEKGGAALSISYVTKKPILYLGTGQSYGDLRPFDKHELLRKLGFS